MDVCTYLAVCFDAFDLESALMEVRSVLGERGLVSVLLAVVKEKASEASVMFQRFRQCAGGGSSKCVEGLRARASLNEHHRYRR